MNKETHYKNKIKRTAINIEREFDKLNSCISNDNELSEDVKQQYLSSINELKSIVKTKLDKTQSV